jgi:chemotaxis protein MotA
MAQGKKSSSKPDVATISGLVLAIGGIVGGLLLEKGSINDIAQYTAALIVLGGTFGAVLVSTPLAVVLAAVKRIKTVLFERADSAESLIEEIIRYAMQARKNGLVSLEQDTDKIADAFLRKALTLAVDGTDMVDIRKMMELEITMHEHRAEAEAKVFECAGGYSPTIGIIGAVLGLIQVMKNLQNIDEVGRGIAVAFVATVYGVAVANICLLPAAAKIKARTQHDVQMKELILEGVGGIVEGLNPKLIRLKLEAYSSPGQAASAKKVPAAEGAAVEA